MRKETITFYCDRCPIQETYDREIYSKDGDQPDGWTEIQKGATYYVDHTNIPLDNETWCKDCTEAFLKWRTSPV